MLALHLLQSSLVYMNTLLLQRVLEDGHWLERLTDADRGGLTPLFWTHVNPYGHYDSTWTAAWTSSQRPPDARITTLRLGPRSGVPGPAGAPRTPPRSVGCSGRGHKGEDVPRMSPWPW